MTGKVEPGYLVFQIFALEVYRKDPELFAKALAAAKANVSMALDHCDKAELPGLEAQAQAADTIHALAGLMKLMNKDNPEDLPDLELDKLRM